MFSFNRCSRGAWEYLAYILENCTRTMIFCGDTNWQRWLQRTVSNQTEGPIEKMLAYKGSESRRRYSIPGRVGLTCNTVSTNAKTHGMNGMTTQCVMEFNGTRHKFIFPSHPADAMDSPEGEKRTALTLSSCCRCCPMGLPVAESQKRTV